MFMAEVAQGEGSQGAGGRADSWVQKNPTEPTRGRRNEEERGLRPPAHPRTGAEEGCSLPKRETRCLTRAASLQKRLKGGKERGRRRE